MKKMLMIAGMVVALAGATGLWTASARSGQTVTTSAETEKVCPAEDCGQGLCLRERKGNCGGQGGGSGDQERRRDRKRDGSCGNTCQM